MATLSRSLERAPSDVLLPAAAVELTFPGFASFLDGEVGNGEAGDRVSLPPPNRGVEPDVEQGGGC